VLHAHGIAIDVLNPGMLDSVIQYGPREEMLADAGLDALGISSAIERQMKLNRISMVG